MNYIYSRKNSKLSAVAGMSFTPVFKRRVNEPDTSQVGERMNRAIITVVGKDTVGIIAKVCTYLADNGINILDISQTIVEDFFNMMMIVDVEKSPRDFQVLVDELEKLGGEIGVQIRFQLEDIFNSMHRL